MRAAGLAPHAGTAHVSAPGAAELAVTLADGATCAGEVVDASGTPAPHVSIETRESDDPRHFYTQSGADGAFRLEGLPAGELVLRAHRNPLGEAEARLVLPQAS